MRAWVNVHMNRSCSLSHTERIYIHTNEPLIHTSSIIAIDTCGSVLFIDKPSLGRMTLFGTGLILWGLGTCVMTTR